MQEIQELQNLSLVGNEDAWLCNIGDDSLSSVLSFLSPIDIVACASVCRHLRQFCGDDKKMWLPMCERRWGSHTLVQKWGRGKIAFKTLFAILGRLENLLGFWRGVGQGGQGSLVTFEWGSHYIIGYRVVPSRSGSYKVCKIPFVWIGVSHLGRSVCLCDPCWTSSYSLSQGSGSLDLSLNLGVKRNPFAKLDHDLDLEQHSPLAGLLVVDLHFVGSYHIVMEEVHQPHFVGIKPRTEAAVVASFGTSGNLADLSSIGDAGSSSDVDGLVQSPPGSFQYEMYQFLASKVTSPGGDRVARKQRRKERARALSQGRRASEPEHFVKVTEFGPTSARPLQGLWKGICSSMGLDFVWLSYDKEGGIVCRRIGQCLGTTHSGWIAQPSSTILAPLPIQEQSVFHARRHILPTTQFDDLQESNQLSKETIDREINDVLDEEVVAVLCTVPITGLDLGSMLAIEKEEGRVWQYGSGRFGFGFVPTNSIMNFRPICSEKGCLIDVVE